MRLFTVLALGLSLIGGAVAQNPADLKAKQAEMTKLEAAYKRAKVAGEKAKPGTPKQKAYIDATVIRQLCLGFPAPQAQGQVSKGVEPLSGSTQA